jgi:predicted glycogen debranching enzyme
MSVADSHNSSSYIVSKDVCRDFARASQLEWLDTNHTGAFAMGTVAGVNTRRYHSLLIASQHPPADRISVLSRVEETVTFAGKHFELASAQYPGTIQPKGYSFLDEFRTEPFPAWRFNLDGVIIHKTLCLLEKEQSVLVCYQTSQACQMRVRLLLSMRDYHSLNRQNNGVSADSRFAERRCSFGPYPGLPSLTVLHSAQMFQPDMQWYFNNEYLREFDRGLDFREDLYSPGSLLFDAPANTRVWFLASIEAGSWDRQIDGATADIILANEAKRRSFRNPLSRALDQFRVTRENNLPSLLAGYPWFTDWSRDTLISLPALSKAGFASAETKKILSMLLEQRSQGLLPNRFCDRQGEVEYNTVDATLWFFVAAHEHIEQSGDLPFLANTLYPAAIEIIGWHNRGTAFDIKNDAFDNLLSAGIAGAQLTWMDAKIGNYVVTPRIGKPVEISALWYNALRITASWAATLGHTTDQEQLTAQADATRESFRRKFWNEQTGCLYDVLGSTANDASIRPNQLFSISLPFPLLELEQAESVVTVVRKTLVTPRGLRTLAATDANYRGRYEGDMRSRDSAYHQGTVWPWLIGPYVAAYLYAFGTNPFSLAYCSSILDDLENEMNTCCLGSLSEVYDGDAPQQAAGCPAQLWSIAQLIMARSLVSGESQAKGAGQLDII